MAGFYLWQTYRDDYRQDDCFLYGLGLDTRFGKFEMTNALGGYLGYIGNGDRPVVYRLAIKTLLTSRINYEFGFQQGISDFQYSTFSAACRINLQGPVGP
jgi:hypothetical protein